MSRNIGDIVKVVQTPFRFVGTIVEIAIPGNAYYVRPRYRKDMLVVVYEKEIINRKKHGDKSI